jgi:hypothetical protein
LAEAYYESEIAKLTPAENATYNELHDNFVDAWPLLIACFSKKYAGSDTFYPNKQQGTEFAKRFKDAKSFWNTYQPGEITLSALSGKSFSDDANLRPMVVWLYGVDETTAQELIDVVQETLAKVPKIGYDFPLWTFNAFALRDHPSNPPEFKAAPVIGLGAGDTKFSEWLGLGDVGPDNSFFHEFGHMVQFAALPSIFEAESTPELSRYIELMADALGGYIAHHPRGASFQTKRIVQFAQSSASVGGCNFNSSGHHGTPAQRAKATYFATDLIDNSKAKGHILTAAECIASFDKAYPNIVAPDKKV